VPVAGGPRGCAGGARSDTERAALVHVGDRPTAGPDRMDVEHRREERVAADPGVKRGGLADRPVDDDPDVGGGAAHVERDQSISAGQ